MDEKDRQIEIFESRIALMANSINLLKEKCDNNEQYSRRTSVRVLNIPVPEGQETADDCMEKIKEVIQNSGADIPDHVIDRAHRVGKVVVNEKDGSKKQAIIVKFTTWRHRTILYRSRKNLDGTKVFLDLTQNNPLVEYVFADVNCTLCAKLSNGKYEHFSNEKELDKILNKFNTVVETGDD